MIKRKITNLVKNELKMYPAVALLGPRQSGKTTLARGFDGNYFDLESESQQLKLDMQWSTVTEEKKLIILDEAQAWPQIFSRIRTAIDQNRKKMGRFLLLGSVSPILMRHVSQSLAGRLGIVELTPFLMEELPKEKIDDIWLYGGFPDGGILNRRHFGKWQKNYLSLLAQRDLPNWGLPAKPQTIQKLLRMIAAVHGQIWNASQIGQSLGLNYQTINSYLDYLTGCFLIRRLESYSTNIRKRLVKSPKVYWRDSGLLHSLLRLKNKDELFAQPYVGASWEGFVIEQITGKLLTMGVDFETYFFRTSDQYEIDLVLDTGKTLWAIETKLTSNPSAGDVAAFAKAADMLKADRKILISRTTEHLENDKVISTNLHRAMEIIK
jgi:predicted AAA+ superfamily ATPase